MLLTVTEWANSSLKGTRLFKDCAWPEEGMVRWRTGTGTCSLPAVTTSCAIMPLRTGSWSSIDTPIHDSRTPALPRPFPQTEKRTLSCGPSQRKHGTAQWSPGVEALVELIITANCVCARNNHEGCRPCCTKLPLNQIRAGG